jgi:hypothetical protein
MRTVTIWVYEEDRAWLQERQREVGFRRGETVPMCDIIRELVQALRQPEGEA